MNKKLEEMEDILKYHIKYGKRGNETFSAWVLRKRSINIAFMVISAVKDMEFHDFELALYFRCDDAKYRKFLRTYEAQMEEAILHSDRFLQNLHEFYWKNSIYIEENHLFKEYFDFCELIEEQRRKKILEGKREIFDAYYSLLMQQTLYFSRDRLEDTVHGIADNGELIFIKNPHPFIDLGSYQLEKYLLAFISGKKELNEKLIYKAYEPYGYYVSDLDEIHGLEAISRAYDNNSYAMIPYINKKTSKLLIKEPYKHHLPNFPREWKSTEIYKEKLKQRNYMLPSAGITATFKNAGDIKEIFFQEVFYHEEIVLLYRVSTYYNGEYSGYYHTKSQTFYSIFEHTNRSEWNMNVENFILENYMVLTCDYDIDRKKNFAIRRVEKLEGEFHYPYQPLAVYSYEVSTKGKKNGDGHSKCRIYNKENYEEEVRTRSGYIRSLPVGYRASEEARQYAHELGLNLGEGKTFVRSHEFKVYRKIQEIY